MKWNIVIQAGHAGRTRGATGTSGPFGAEKVWTERTAKAAVPRLTALGWTVTWTLADAPVPDSDVFVALHQDGSVNKSARGPSVGYPSSLPACRDAAQAWKAEYAKHYPGPAFRKDNYTTGLAHYYGCNPSKRAGSSAPARFICEHGFATNHTDAEWMWSPAGLDAVVAAINAAAWHHLGPQIAAYLAAVEEAEPAVEESSPPVTGGSKAVEAAPVTGGSTGGNPPPEPDRSSESKPPAPAPVVPEPAEQPDTVLPMSDAAARSAWTAMQAAVPLLAHHQFIGADQAEGWHYLAITAFAALLSLAKSAVAGRTK